jgi:hypothetical protein
MLYNGDLYFLVISFLREINTFVITHSYYKRFYKIKGQSVLIFVEVMPERYWMILADARRKSLLAASRDIEIVSSLSTKFIYEMARITNSIYMKWLRYQRVISLKIQVGNTNQRNKWANMDPRIYRRWDQVPRRSKHPLLFDHTRCEPSSMIMNAELSAVKVSVSCTV